ncbi:MAG: ABC transporter permease [Firmicutes bacterium]|nr:ABC transporter permease [Bacillota bacterium]
MPTENADLLSKLRRYRNLLISIFSVVTFISVWELVGRLGLVSPVFLPSPSLIYREGVMLFQNGVIQTDILASTRRVLVGFGISAAVAVPLGLLMGTSETLKAIFDPILSIIRPLPALSWIPLSMLWLGIGESQKYAIVFMGAFAPTLVYVIDATRRVDPLVIKAAKNLGASRLAVLREVILPGAMPNIISGLKVVLAVAWTCIISAEMVGASNGLGYRIWSAKDWGNTPQVLLGMVGISLTVLVIDTIFKKVEEKLIPWERNRR